MLNVKKALVARGLANNALTTKLGGPHVYQPEQELDFGQLVQGGAVGFVLFNAVTENSDIETGYAAQVYQMDILAKTSDLADEIAELVESTYGWRSGVAGSGTLPALTGRRLAEPITVVPGPRDIAREQGGPGALHRRTRSIRVATYPA